MTGLRDDETTAAVFSAPPAFRGWLWRLLAAAQESGRIEVRVGVDERYSQTYLVVGFAVPGAQRTEHVPYRTSTGVDGGFMFETKPCIDGNGRVYREAWQGWRNHAPGVEQRLNTLIAMTDEQLQDEVDNARILREYSQSNCD